MRAVVMVNTDRYIVSDASGLPGFRHDAVEAVRSGGALVRLDHDHGTSELLISASTPLRIDSLPDRPAPSRSQAEVAFIDFDAY